MDNKKYILLDFYIYLQKEKSLSEHTIKAYKNDLNRFISSPLFRKNTNFQHLNRQSIRGFLGKEIDKGYSSKTIARRLCSIKSLYKYLYKIEIIKRNPTLSIKSPKISKSLPNFIDQKVIESLMKIPDESTNKGLRDRAILELFYSTGIRLSELIALNIEEIDSVNQLIKVHGKGDKERLIPFGNRAKFCIKNYLKNRGLSFSHAPKSEPLFVNEKSKRVPKSTIQRRIRNYIKLVAVGKNLGPHILRHSFATHLMERGADIRSIKDLLGHSSLSSTQIYTHINLEKMKSTYKQAHPRGGK
jgi:integrase/recombinase XerC